mmetsp:Transcript_18531/g.44124  ORF Transcript_18531/g.44124 Transcript_18531/m.44124 type:complete len:233 (+) Transcript_18531:2343-3041(+)
MGGAGCCCCDAIGSCCTGAVTLGPSLKARSAGSTACDPPVICASLSRGIRAKSSYTRRWWGSRPPALGRSTSGRYRSHVWTWSMESWKGLPGLCRCSSATSNATSMSRTAFSVADFSIRLHPRSRFSAATSCAACSTVWASKRLVLVRRVRIWLHMLWRRGSLHVTKARLPARFCTIMCAAALIFCSSCSRAKSLSASSRVVMQAMVTERSTTGDTMSLSAWLTACMTACTR